MTEATFAIPNFRFGLDQRRPRVAGASGTLWNIENAHLTRGGDIEGAKAFVPVFTMPAGTFGLIAVASVLYVFGSADLAATVPLGVTYQRLVAPNSPNMVSVLDSEAYNGLPYVVAEYDDGNIYHFYNGARVTDWDAIGAANSSYPSLAAYLATLINGIPAVVATSFGATLLLTSQVPGVADAISATAVNGGSTNDQTATVTTPQAAVAAVAETLSTATLQITGGTFSPGLNRLSQVFAGATPIMLAPVDWTLSNTATANAVAAQINNQTATSGYSAAPVADTVTISAAPETGATPNGVVVSFTALGNVTAAATSFAGGVSAVAPVAQIVQIALGGTYEAADFFTVTVNGTTVAATGQAAGTGITAFVLLDRIYSCANTHLQYCGINEPTNWTDSNASSGAGFINMASQTDGAERLVGTEVYSTFAVIFSARSARLYNLTADATQVSLFQQMKNTGGTAGRSLQSFANTDLFYLGVSGVRSLKAKDTTNAAYANDAGAAIDTHIQAWMKSIGPAVSSRAVSVIEPLDQRYWLAIGNRIYVYSYFPSTQIAAWSYYTPGFTISSLTTIDEKLYCQSGNTIYLYGGASGQVYQAAGGMPITIETPFLAAGKPEDAKIWTDFNMAAQGVWSVSYLVNPNDWTQTINGGTIVNSTYSGPVNNIVGRSPLFSLTMTCSSAGYRNFSGYSASFLEKSKGFSY